ncbi:MAG: hypothetical protein HY700_00030 [Gemmatimonadetes bacterium]|nr:hypothetical protein [Gemmatimonadota bacterium]
MAQNRPPLQGRVDPATLAALRPVLAAAAAESLPTRPLEDKALEGVAKRVPSARIIDAVQQLVTSLREARGLLRSGSPAPTPSEAEIVAAADARRRGVPSEEIAALRREAASSPLVVPLTILSDLVERGVPADQARSVIAEMASRGTPMAQIAQIPGRVDVALRVGASPAEALRGALPGAARGKPESPPAGRPASPGTPTSTRGKGKVR